MRQTDTHRVGVAFDRDARYNGKPPFHPSCDYPEYRYGTSISSDAVDGYALVRDALYQLGLDRDNFDTPKWNPLGDVISPGDKVALKPNWVLDKHPRSSDIFSVITHPSIIRAVLDYVLIALDGHGSVAVCDAPQGDCDFDRLRKLSSLDDLREFYVQQGGIVPAFVDLRKIRYLVDDDGYILNDARIELDGDPYGYREVNLGEDSLLNDLSNLNNLYGADYDRDFTNKHHCDGRHEYLVSGTVLSADVVISIPKMKTHKKTGVTLNLKNLVGINGDKNYLAHFRMGASDSGGDEYPSAMDSKKKLVLKSQRMLIDRLLVKPNRLSVAAFNAISKTYRGIRRITGIDSRPDIRNGDWFGNDTAWRMVVDLNRILFLAATDGVMADEPQRRYLSIVDGLLAGEGDGPLDPDPINAGLVLAGMSPTPVDLVGTTLMGLDYTRLHLYDYIVGEGREAVSDVGRVPSSAMPDEKRDTSIPKQPCRVSCPIESACGTRPTVPYAIDNPNAITIGFEDREIAFNDLPSAIPPLNFRPHYGWAGHIELSEALRSSASEFVQD